MEKVLNCLHGFIDAANVWRRKCGGNMIIGFDLGWLKVFYPLIWNAQLRFEPEGEVAELFLPEADTTVSRLNIGEVLMVIEIET
jgi:hypothetical protein